MANPRSFGRRSFPGGQPDARQAVAVAIPKKRPTQPATAVSSAPVTPGPLPAVATDEEKHDGDAPGYRGFAIPWRQVSLMASLCFGAASLVLPDSVSDVLQWVAFGLAAISLYTTFIRRRTTAKARLLPDASKAVPD